MGMFEGNIIESISHYEKVKELLEGRKDEEAIKMIAHCIAVIEEYNQFDAEEEDNFKEEEEESAQNPPNYMGFNALTFLMKEEEMD
jgi:hypothetical protein